MPQLSIKSNARGIRVKLKDGQDTISECKISILDNVWSISEWYTYNTYKHKGYGNVVMKEALSRLYKDCGEPDEIRYIWNGVNAYVMDWLTKHFDPVSSLPLEVQKTSETDVWEAHIYILNKEKVLEYFEVKDQPNL